MTIRGYQLAADWSRQGTFTGTLEDLTTPGTGIVASDDLSVSWGRNDARATEDSTAGQLQFKLNNHTRNFSPENAASPIAGTVLPGTRTRLQVTANGAITTLFDGPIDTFTVDSATAARTFSATALDGWGVPGAEKLSTPVYSGMRTGGLINVILDAIGWDPAKRDIDPGVTAVDWWWSEGQDAATAVNDLVHSEGPPAIAYVAGGIFTFRDRHHRLTRTQSLTGPATVATYTFETGISDYTAVSGGTAASTTAQAHSGTRSLLMTVTGSPSQTYVRPTRMIGVNPGRSYRATMWVYSPSAVTVTHAIDWYSDPNTYQSGLYPSTTLVANTWTQLVVAGTAPAGVTRVAFGPSLAGNPANGTQLFLDDVLFEQTDATQALFTHIQPAGTGPDGDLKIDKGSFVYDHGLASIVNTVTFAVTPRVVQNPATVWSTTSAISLAAGEVRQLIVQGNDPFIGAQIPQPYTYDADGNPVTGEYQITGGSLASITLSRTSGQTCIMTITAGGSGCFLAAGMSLTATPIAAGDPVQVFSQDTASVSAFRQQNWTGDTPPWCNAYDAQAIADRIVAVYAGPRPVITFTVTTSVSAPNVATVLPALLGRAISDRVTVRNDDEGINADYMIERLGHVITKLGARHQLQVGVQAVDPVQPSNVFTFDVPGQGFDQGYFGVNGIPDATGMFQFDVAGHGFDQGKFAI